MGCAHGEPYLGRLSVLAKPETLPARESLMAHGCRSGIVLRVIGCEILYAVSAILLQLYSDTRVDKHPPISNVGNLRLHSTLLDHSAFYGSHPLDRALCFLLQQLWYQHGDL